jgi:hypothetical protein
MLRARLVVYAVFVLCDAVQVTIPIDRVGLLQWASE